MNRKIRILIAIDCTGGWHAFGGSLGEPDRDFSDEALRTLAYEDLEEEEGIARFVWVEAEIPPPHPEQEVEAVVSDE